MKELKNTFGNNLNEIEELLKTRMIDVLDNYRINLLDVSDKAENKLQLSILQNSFTLSLMVNIAILKLKTEFIVAKESGFNTEEMINICRINKNVFEQVSNQISKNINDFLKKEIGGNISII